ncbi:MAG: hypothetical protein J7K96_06675 [Desulfobacteraceae bacterium]|nr:hypothetical protein [Desulfobacteraceae bacterium]
MDPNAVIHLDTHVIIWLYARKGKGLSRRAIDAIESGADLFISPMAFLELDLLKEIGRITVGADIICGYLKNKIGLRLCDHPFAAVIRKASTYQWTRDPFDRIITAQAAATGNALITKDTNIRDHYPRAVW